MSERTHPFPGNVLMHVDDMGAGDSGGISTEDIKQETRTVTENLDAAMLLTSHYTHERAIWHRPVIDIDLPVTVVESSPGKHHLMINKVVGWPEYLRLLFALRDAGIVEPGYVRAAEARGFTAVRVPWFKKGDLAPNIDGARPEVQR